MNKKEEGKSENIQSSEAIGTVHTHTHTHTQVNLKDENIARNMYNN